jgi:aspartate-semialdehyde dehydrogenase
VRVGALRCHSQAVTLKLTRSASIKEIEDIIQKSNQWVEIIPNEIDITKQLLTPIYVSGKLTIAVGRIRKMILGDDYLTLFTVGDQLLWGAAEPLRRILRILIADKC